MKNKTAGLILTVLFCITISGRVRAEDQTQSLSVFVSIPPQQYMVERIGGEHVTVHVLVHNQQDPHTFEPLPKQIMRLSQAKVFFIIGFPFETALINKIHAIAGSLKIIDTGKDVKKVPMEGAHGLEDTGNTPVHDHAGEPDPHIWLSLPLVKIQAQAIAAGLEQIDPAHTADYEHNLSVFLKDIDDTHKRITQMLTPYKGRSFYVFHPSFGYFARDYGLQQEAVEIEGKVPTPKQLAYLIEKAKAENIRIIFVQPQFDKKSVETIASSIGGRVVPLDSLEKDVLKNCDEIADHIKNAFVK